MENHLRSYTAIEQGQIKDPIFALEVFSNLANDYFRHGDLEKAVTFYHKALATLEEMARDSQSFAEKYVEIGQAYKSAGRLAMALAYITRSVALDAMHSDQKLVGLPHH